MNSWRLLAVATAAVIAAVALALAPLRPALAQGAGGAEPVKLRVEIIDSGFQPAAIEVQQGQSVEITFVWAHQAYMREEHIMVLDGYKLETDKLNAEHREATLKFIADKPGSFNFKCDLDCELHDYLQRGSLKVGRGSGGGAGSGSGASGAAAALTATTLSLTPPFLVMSGEPVSLLAVLKDAKGAGVSKAEVQFYLDTEFAGTKGQMALGVAKTNANGVATLNYRPTIAVPQHNIAARFEGMGLYGESQAATQLILANVVLGVPGGQMGAVSLPPPAYVQEPVGLEGIRHWAPAALATAVLSVWLVFGFVLYQAFGISRVSGKRQGLSADGRSAYDRLRR